MKRISVGVCFLLVLALTGCNVKHVDPATMTEIRQHNMQNEIGIWSDSHSSFRRFR